MSNPEFLFQLCTGSNIVTVHNNLPSQPPHRLVISSERFPFFNFLSAAKLLPLLVKTSCSKKQKCCVTKTWTNHVESHNIPLMTWFLKYFLLWDMDCWHYSNGPNTLIRIRITTEWRHCYFTIVISVITMTSLCSDSEFRILNSEFSVNKP